jgi:hypothetical protein
LTTWVASGKTIVTRLAAVSPTDEKMPHAAKVLVFLGLGSTVFSYLLFRSRYVPRSLSGWW